MKTGYIEYDTVTEFETEIDTGDIFVVSTDCGIYNIIFKKQLTSLVKGIFQTITEKAGSI